MYRWAGAITPRLAIGMLPDETWRILLRVALISGSRAVEEDERLTVTGPATRGRRVR